MSFLCKAANELSCSREARQERLQDFNSAVTKFFRENYIQKIV